MVSRQTPSVHTPEVLSAVSWWTPRQAREKYGLAAGPVAPTNTFHHLVSLLFLLQLPTTSRHQQWTAKRLSDAFWVCKGESDWVLYTSDILGLSFNASTTIFVDPLFQLQYCHSTNTNVSYILAPIGRLHEGGPWYPVLDQHCLLYLHLVPCYHPRLVRGVEGLNC